MARGWARVARPGSLLLLTYFLARLRHDPLPMQGQSLGEGDERVAGLRFDAWIALAKRWLRWG